VSKWYKIGVVVLSEPYTDIVESFRPLWGGDRLGKKLLGTLQQLRNVQSNLRSIHCFVTCLAWEVIRERHPARTVSQQNCLLPRPRKLPRLAAGRPVTTSHCPPPAAAESLCILKSFQCTGCTRTFAFYHEYHPHVPDMTSC
jgi:hypothetical protein